MTEHNRFVDFRNEINSTFLQMFGVGVDAIFTEVIIEGEEDRHWFCIYSDILDLPWTGYTLDSDRHALLESRFEYIDIGFLESPGKNIQYRVFYEQNSSIGQQISSFARRISRKLEINFRAMIEDLSDEIKLVSIDTTDLPSFLHKSVLNILPKYLSIDAASAFYNDESTDSLVLGSTTGLEMQNDRSDFRRGAIRYFLDENSYSVKSYKSESCIFEYSSKMDLKKNTLGESVSDIYQRTYFPITIRNSLLKKAECLFDRGQVGGHAIGILRILNVQTYGMKSPLSLINYCIIKHFCESLSILGARYQTASRVLHDMERATHGFSTDLTTLRLALQLSHRYQDSFSKSEAQLLRNILNSDDLQEMKDRTRKFLSTSSTMRREVDIQLQNALAVQDSMAFQVLNVHMHTERSVFSERLKTNAICREPYREVFMRVSGSLEAMSQTFDRKRVQLTWKRAHNANGVQDLPRLAVPPELLYLVVRNLVENSIKYCPIDRAPMVKIDWRIISNKIEFGFRDNGIGIEKDDQPKIFRDGWRARQANSLSFRGNGLGLAVCKSVLSDFGGDLAYGGTGIGGIGSQFNLAVRTY